MAILWVGERQRVSQGEAETGPRALPQLLRLSRRIRQRRPRAPRLSMANLT